MEEKKLSPSMEAGNNIFRRLETGEEPIIKNINELAYACGLIIQYLITKEPTPERAKAAKRNYFVRTADMKELKKKTETYIEQQRSNLFDSNRKVQHLVGDILSTEIEEGENKNFNDDVDSSSCFTVGLLIQKNWARNNSSEEWQKKNKLISKSYKLNSELVEEFAKACENAGVSQAGKLSEMMKGFIEETKQ